MARPLSERLSHELLQVRVELREVIAQVSDADIDWAPAGGMKSYRKQLLEIGAMQAETAIIVVENRMPEWEECQARVQGDTFQTIIASLDSTLNELLNQLKTLSDDQLKGPFSLGEDNAKFFGVERDVEIEELVRWIGRHEYYHLGQIISYRWIQGVNPYEHVVPTME